MPRKFNSVNKNKKTPKQCNPWTDKIKITKNQTHNAHTPHNTNRPLFSLTQQWRASFLATRTASAAVAPKLWRPGRRLRRSSMASKAAAVALGGGCSGLMSCPRLPCPPSSPLRYSRFHPISCKNRRRDFRSNPSPPFLDFDICSLCYWLIDACFVEKSEQSTVKKCCFWFSYFEDFRETGICGLDWWRWWLALVTFQCPSKFLVEPPLLGSCEFMVTGYCFANVVVLPFYRVSMFNELTLKLEK